MMSSPDRIHHCFTVDLEEYFQVVALAPIAPRDRWETFPRRAAAATDRLLDLLARHGATATFFTVGWLAEREPDLVRRIAAAGHEVASHSWWHRPLGELSPEEMLDDVRRTRDLLEDLVSGPVTGFRAPSFSIVPGREWAFDVLLEAGYRYDSSIFPIRRTDYGYPSAPTRPYLVKRPLGQLWELPLATTDIAGMRLPAAGGGYLRHLPFGLIRRALREHCRQNQPAMFYVHPWEWDTEQPRLAVSPLARWRHYGGLAKTWPRLERLLAEFSFSSIAAQATTLFAADAGSYNDGDR